MNVRRQRSAAESIVIEGARENNLQNVSLRIPKGKLTVFTGVSGSGKSSIVFKTIAVESQRQLNETFSSFIRNRLPKHERPKADVIENLSAAIVVDQRPIGGNSRSTVGTMTELHPLLRVLFSRCAQPRAGSSNLYSFNDPRGMCVACQGLGHTVRLDLGRLLDEDKSLNQGAIRFPSFAVGTFQWQLYGGSGLFDPDKPLKEFSEKDRELFLHGEGFRVERAGRKLTYSNAYEGIVTRFTRRYLARGLERLKDGERAAVEQVVSASTCQVCAGARLNEVALASKINGRNIADLCRMEISDLISELSRIKQPVARPIVAAAIARLRRLDEIGLGYLTLDRQTSTVSGGEGQRLKTVRHLSSSLTGMTYIFDEPSVGLHPRDVHRLNDLLLALRDKGNTVLVVEHDPDVILLADHIIDMGPLAGAHGGEVVFQGTVKQLLRADTLTGQRLRHRTGLKDAFRAPTGALTLRQARRHNLQNVSLDIPTGVLTAVTGVAGSGKSTLICGVFASQYPDTVVVDQSAIGISSRSTPASYVEIHDSLRRLFAQANGVDASLFSFNSAGACPECAGRGTIETDLAYLDPITTVCERCQGRRFRDEVLDYTLDGKNIVEVLALTVEDSLAFFREPSVLNGLSTLQEVGLGYLTLGQPLSTLSGGERQRLKLAHRLREVGTVYVFDEPTTGLHLADLDNLVALLDRLVDAGNTVVVIEHNLDLVKRADWVIDLGPEAGRHGGQVIFEGTPVQLLDANGSFTAEFLRKDLAALAPQVASR
jgi:excinuclease UvrABC ATPase subunit